MGKGYVQNDNIVISFNRLYPFHDHSWIEVECYVSNAIHASHLFLPSIRWKIGNEKFNFILPIRSRFLESIMRCMTTFLLKMQLFDFLFLHLNHQLIRNVLY